MDVRAAADLNIRVHWMSLGELSRLIETFQTEGVTRAVMAGQVKHTQIFSSSGPELQDIAYGRTVARAIAAYDLGQTVVIAAQACVAVEAMEGTDATIERAGDIFRTFESPSHALPETTLRRSLTVVKVAKPNQDMRFDVPVIGVATIRTMQAAGATCLAVEAGKTLLFDTAAILAAANQANIAIVAM